MEPNAKHTAPIAEELHDYYDLTEDGDRVRWLAGHVDTLSEAAIDAVLDDIWAFSDPLTRREAFTLIEPHLNDDQIETVLGLIDSLSEPFERLHLQAQLLPRLEERSQQQRVKALLDQLYLMSHPADQVALLQALAPYLPDHRQNAALSQARGIVEPEYRAAALAALAPTLEPRSRAEVLAEALNDARQPTDPGQRAYGLTRLAPVLSDRLRTDVVLDALAAASEIEEPTMKAWALVDLMPLLDKDQKNGAINDILGALDAIPDEVNKATDLVEVGRHLPADQRPALQNLAERISDPEPRSRALLGLDSLPMDENIALPPDGKASLETGSKRPQSTAERSSAYRSVPTHLDMPADEDDLNRRPFAEVVAVGIRQAYRQMRERKAHNSDDGPGDAFLVHLHGQWGSGKSTVLNFLRDSLTGESDEAREAGAAPWLVVTFNAWRHQHLGPPWWALIHCLYDQSRNQLKTLDASAARRLLRHDLAWRFRTRLGPLVLTAALLLWFLSLSIGGDASTVTEAVKTWLEASAVIFAVGGTLLGGFRTLLLGSAQAARVYTELSRDPMRPIADYFQRLIRATRRPVAIFIDDLDRCDSDYVVELLRGIQTLFRRDDVTYVVAADRDWLRSCYESDYATFSNAIGEPGRPLGYLFLEKVFQVSVGLPRLSGDARDRYLSRLLAMGEGTSKAEQRQQQLVAERKAEDDLRQSVSGAEFSERIDQARHDPAYQRALRIVAAKRMLTPEVQQHTEHVLTAYAHLLEPNPRAMKRLVNAFGLQQAVNWLSERDVPEHPLILWTILQLRWPLLADHLTRHPDQIEFAGTGRLPEDLDEEVRALLGSRQVLPVIRGEGVADGQPLNAAQIRRIVGDELGEAECDVR